MPVVVKKSASVGGVDLDAAGALLLWTLIHNAGGELRLRKKDFERAAELAPVIKIHETDHHIVIQAEGNT